MKKICIVLLASLACFFAVSCDKEETNDAPVCSAKRFKLRAPQFADASGSKVYLQFTDAASSLIYEDGDIIYINGHECTLENDHNTWYANCSEEIVGSRFLAVYADGTINPASFDSTAGTYQYNLTTNLTSPAHNKIVLGGVADTLHEGDYVITLKPACAILRINTQGAGGSWTYAKVGFEGQKIPKAGTINVSTRAIDHGGPSNYMNGVAQGSGGVITGDFLYMRYSNPSTTGESDYWYVAIPIEGDEVQTTLYLEWNNGSTTVQYKTQGQVPLHKGYVYTLGTERVSPFTAKGASRGLFNVAAGRQVRISAGNLQTMRTPNPETGNYTYKWQFANHQYDNLGSSNGTNIQDNDAWFELFGYGTSGYNAGQTARFPNSTSTTPGDYIATAIANTSSDWGKYLHTYANYKLYYGTAEVSSENWRTLTSDEWSYLINRTGKAGLATVAGVNGLILIPDYFPGGWNLPDGVSFTATFSDYATNNYDATNWDKLESAGAIFLPVTGYRSGTGVSSISNGYYWSTSLVEEIVGGRPQKLGPVLVITSNSATMVNTNRTWGCAVRLVVEIEEE